MNERVRQRRTSGHTLIGEGRLPEQASQARAIPRVARDGWDPDAEAARFWPKVTTTANGCWAWTGAVSANGYGRFRVRRAGRWTHLYAHRWAFEATHGPIPEGIYLDHLCHTNDPHCPGGPSCPHRRCVNPDHLDGTTDDDENRRRARQRRNGPSTGTDRRAT